MSLVNRNNYWIELEGKVFETFYAATPEEAEKFFCSREVAWDYGPIIEKDKLGKPGPNDPRNTKRVVISQE